jgi:hypothetical protein
MALGNGSITLPSTSMASSLGINAALKFEKSKFTL